MPKVRNVLDKAETPLPQLQQALAELKPGQVININNTKEEIMRTRENLTRMRHEIPGADDHIDYIEALLLAEANGKLQFKP
ncbi:MAG: hypothetical protein EBR82_00230 [Caulobacteraceae bacterium]|jgi:TusA-related sulfurtransferase|nr:hypothetical protein [Caulobacteraceae bacterium]